jgi:dephospho-CoA kinase
VLRVGLTGGLASGKSLVAELFERRGASVIHADEIAHQLMAPGESVHQQVIKHFGRQIVKADGSIDRVRLAALAFDGGRIAELNAIVHPAVIAQQEQWMDEVGKENPHAVAMVEAALLMEAGVADHFDKIVVVTCGNQQRAPRFAARTGLNAEQAAAEVARRMRAQLAEEEKARRADYVIDNSGTPEATEQQVDKIYTELARLAASTSRAAG